jgi:ParB/RepB/Spo0J family partition protein
MPIPLHTPTHTTGPIPVDRIDPDPDQPRKHFDETALNDLTESIRAIGQLQPIAVRIDPTTDRYRIVAGERRWRAAQRAGLTHLQAVVLHLDDDQVLPAAVAENVGRADMTPMEEAVAFRRLADAGHTRDEIARMCGRSVEYVGYRIDLLNLIAPAREALNRGHLLVGTAWYVAKLSAAGQQRFLSKLVRGDFPTARDAEAFAQACRVVEDNRQDGFFAVEEMTEERRAQVHQRRRQVTSKVDRLAGAGEILLELARTDPAELALLLEGLPGGVAGYRMRAEHLRDAAGKAVAILRKAAAIVAAATPDSLTPGTIF